MMGLKTNHSAILAIYNVNLKTRGHIGVMRKVLAQARGFSLNNKQIHMICGEGPNIVRLVFEYGIEIEREILTTEVVPGDFFVHVAGWLANQKTLEGLFEWAYVRYNPMHNNELILLASNLHKLKVPLFIEMYTLEYQNEMPLEAAKIDQTFFSELAPLVTGFFTPSKIDAGAKLNGRPLLKMSNGATWIQPTTPKPKPDIRKAFHLLGVGYLANWHGYDLEKRLQSEDRAHRIGQKKNVTYIDIICEDTVDEKIVKALRDKINVASEVLGEELRDWI